MNNNEHEILLEALNNGNNESIMNTNKAEIQKIKNDILQQLYLPREILKDFHKRLKKYRYCDEMPDLISGQFIR